MSSLNRKRHRWSPEVVLVDGEHVVRDRCARCAIMATWPGAADMCEGIEPRHEDPAKARARALKSWHARKQRRLDEQAAADALVRLRSVDWVERAKEEASE